MQKRNVRYWLEKMPHDSIFFVSCITVLIGLFLSRALISIGMIWLAGNAIVHARLGNNFRRFLHEPHLLLLSGYFLLMAVTALWSTNTAYLLERLQILLPFLFLPFAFHAAGRIPIKHTDALFALFILLTATGIGWSMWHYLQAKDLYDTGYGFSRSIPTPFKNDHIRFSLAVVLSITFAVNLFPRAVGPLRKSILALFIACAAVYLHILAAKSGLLVFYLYTLLLLSRLCMDPLHRRIGLMLLILVILLPVMMFRVSQTFRNKIGYVRYSVSMIMNSTKDANVSDEGRLISYRYALDQIKQHPFTGVGLGDVMDEMKQAYSAEFAQQNVTALLPHNQFLMAGMAAGISGILYLLWMMIILFRNCIRRDFLSTSFVVMMVLAMMVEPFFETQYGTCMFVFFLLLLLQRGDDAI